jgi:purine-nucleoside phosphorylase
MNPYFTRIQIEGAAAIIRNRTRYEPTIGLVLGSGLNDLADAVEYPDTIANNQIPHWPQSTVPGHHGRLVIGKLEDKTVLVMQGRVHFYEGYSPNQITLPVRVMQILGIKTLLLTNAAGGINETFTPGDLMLLKDHLNIPGMAGHNPLRGPNEDSFGPRFPDMITPYDPGLRQMAHDIAAESGFSLQEGVYGYVAGPNYETPAELRFLQLMGADAVGMSTVPSVLVARHAGMRVLGVSTITNMALPDPPPGAFLSHDEVLETGKIAIPRLTALLHGIIRRL